MEALDLLHRRLDVILLKISGAALRRFSISLGDRRRSPYGRSGTAQGRLQAIVHAIIDELDERLLRQAREQFSPLLGVRAVVHTTGQQLDEVILGVVELRR